MDQNTSSMELKILNDDGGQDLVHLLCIQRVYKDGKIVSIAAKIVVWEKAWLIMAAGNCLA